MKNCFYLLVLLFFGCATAPRYTREQGPSSAGSRGTHQGTPRKSSGARKRTVTGVASYYGKKFHGRTTASGERFDMYALTAAHRTLAFGTMVTVTYLKTGKSVTVRINDRGPHKRGRIIDLSYNAAKRIGLLADGTGRVSLKWHR